MSLLIIGGAGYVGSHATKLFCDKGYDVIVYDNLSTGFQDAVDARSVFVNGDIRDYKKLVEVIIKYKIKSVIHFAAASLVGESVINPLKYYDNNVYGMQELLKAMVDTDVKNIIFSSTAAVYGDQNSLILEEENDTNPINPYGESKLAMEKMIKWVAKAHEINFVSLRYFNVAGAIADGSVGERHNPETHLIPKVLKAHLNGEKILIFGDDYNTEDGTCVRDYIHVVDLIGAHILALEYLENGGESSIINLGYGHGFSVKEIIDSAQKIVGSEIEKEIVARRGGDPDILVASNKKALDILKWVPKYDDLDTIISDAFNFHRRIK